MEGIGVILSGFYSQGGGACITFEKQAASEKLIQAFCAENDLSKFKEKCLLEIAENYGVDIESTHSGHYYHENSMTVSVDCYYSNIYKNIDILWNNFESWLRGLIKDKSAELYKTLEKTYTYLMSDECIQEHLQNTDARYLKTGEVCGL